MARDDDRVIRPVAILIAIIVLSTALLTFSAPVQKRLGLQWSSRIILSAQRMAGRSFQSLKGFVSSIRSIGELRILYEKAISELNNYRGMQRELLELKRENEILRENLRLSTEITNENIPSQIIADDPANLFDTLTIDKGTESKIEVGMAVTAFQDGFFGLVGKVVSVSKHSAQVRPLVDPSHFVAARLQKTRFIGLVSGMGKQDGTLIMKYVQKTARSSISLDDLVITSGTKSIYPKNIVIGRLKEIRSQEYSNSLELILEPVINLRQVEYVFILASKKANLL